MNRNMASRLTDVIVPPILRGGGEMLLEYRVHFWNSMSSVPFRLGNSMFFLGCVFGAQKDGVVRGNRHLTISCI